MAAASSECWAEAQRYKQALLAYYRSKGCGMVLFERHTSTAGEKTGGGGGRRGEEE
jgi:hypothetical protein